MKGQFPNTSLDGPGNTLGLRGYLPGQRYGYPHTPFDFQVSSDYRMLAVIIGDSIYQGTQDNPTTVPPVDCNGKGFEALGSTIVQIGRFDLQTIHNGGSPWPQFCVDMYDQIGIRPIIQNSAVYGSSFYTTSGVLSWYTNGTLYASMVTKTRKAIISSGITRPVFMINLGINDITSAETTGNITTAITSLIVRLNADFNSPQILYNIPGYSNNTRTARYATINNFLFDLELTYPNVQNTINMTSMLGWNYYGTSVLHLIQTGQNMLGTLNARMLVNKYKQKDRDVKRVLNSTFHDTISPMAANELANGIIWQKRDGNWQTGDLLQIYKANTEKNALVDLMGRCSPVKPTAGFDFRANDYISFDGIAKYLRTMYAQSFSQKNCSQDNVMFGCKTGVNSTPAGTAATLFGAAGGAGMSLGQSATQTTFRMNNATPQNYATDNKIQNNTRYAVQRNNGGSNNMNLYKNSVQVSPKTVASAGTNATLADVGCQNNANPDTPTAATFMNVQTIYHWSQPSTANLASWEAFLDRIESVL